MIGHHAHRALQSAFIALLGLTHVATATIEMIDLRCEGKTHPLAVPAAPSLSWKITTTERNQSQTAWQILVASSLDLLEESKADLWASKKTTTQRSPLVQYAGKPLKSGQRCYWKVRAWDAHDKASSWSAPSTFEVAPITPVDWQGAKWINDGKANPTKDEDFYQHDPAPLFRKDFQLNKPIKRARLHVVGLGLCLPSINGQRIEDHIFDPPWTDFADRILFRTHDVTTQLTEGNNCLGLTVGNGFFNPLPLRKWGHRNLQKDILVGRPRVIASLIIDHPDDTQTIITTNDDWKTTEGPSRRNDIYIGEIRDARCEIPGWDQAGFDDSHWKSAKLSEASLQPLEPLGMLPIRPRAKISAVALTTPKPNTHIVDFGTNFTGIPEIDFNVSAGTKITLRYGELVYSDGTLNPMTSVTGQIKNNITLEDGTVQSAGGPGAPTIAWQEDTYIAKGGGETYRPDFTYHAFRFMEVTGLTKTPKLEDFRAIPFNTQLPKVGSFECSNNLFNQIQKLCLQTFLSNVIGVQSDCPHRERFGYGGDIVATSEAFIMNFDMDGFYTKTVRDWADAALPNGLFPDTAPYVGVKYCGVGWGMVHPHLIEQIYQHYGNKTIIEEQLPIAIRWIDAEAQRRENGLVTTGLGDHEALVAENRGPDVKTPKFIDAAKRIARLARIIGDEINAKRCDAYAAESLAAWEKEFLTPETGKIANGNQTQQVFALGFSSTTPDTEAKIFTTLVKDLTKTEDSPRLTTGIYGTWKLLEELPKHGRNDLAYSLANRKTFPSWGWMLENDATTLWEHWAGSDNTFSNNHPMFGSVSAWFFRWLGGIQVAPDAVGFDRLLIHPKPTGDLQWVKTSHHSVRGEIISNWEMIEKGTRYDITIPPDTTATLLLPIGKAATITESGKLLASTQELKVLARDAEQITIEIGNGRFLFETLNSK